MTRDPGVRRRLGGLFVSACLAGAAAAQPPDALGRCGPTVCGQLDLGVQAIDDGVEATRGPVDNAHSTSRLGLRFHLPLGVGTLRFAAETALGPRSMTDTGRGGARPAIGRGCGDIRRLEVA